MGKRKETEQSIKEEKTKEKSRQIAAGAFGRKIYAKMGVVSLKTKDLEILVPVEMPPK